VSRHSNLSSVASPAEKGTFIILKQQAEKKLETDPVTLF